MKILMIKRAHACFVHMYELLKILISKYILQIPNSTLSRVIFYRLSFIGT